MKALEMFPTCSKKIAFFRENYARLSVRCDLCNTKDKISTLNSNATYILGINLCCCVKCDASTSIFIIFCLR